MSHSIETYHLHAYLDGELSHDECIEVEKALLIDTDLRKQLDEFKALKVNVQQTYESIPESNIQLTKRTPKKIWSIPKTAAASLFLGLVIGAGLLNVVIDKNGYGSAIEQPLSENYLVHLDSDTPEKQQQAIREIEALLSSGSSNVKVDLVSNFKGVQLFDVKNPNNSELTRLLDKYDNLTLFACKRALDRAIKNGKPITLMPKVQHDKPAIDAVVERLNSGWNYMKI
ncbi:zf-HC2 domain-containing protein [Thiomicrorhabdus lithotrophica]|uniref:Zf-HC2 domain-containing protein n=1 Tax=Thiomicrorhabdus lithotrophica TaxID=2949997 RepID=A0ABY8CB53_9GAMM|nr:zf-HC2 domain-containing protein [Thiomicrorhabdus lithotrophica]WEJ62727.1 zf-HC2 domain-containing protein [Thiomicrorhabdus lithotrophica]